MNATPLRPSLLRLSVALLAVGMVAGCSTTREVDMRMLLPAGAPLMHVPENQVLLMAAPLSQPMPAFPADAPVKGEVSTCIEMVVDASGGVSAATPLYGLPECPLAQAQIDPRIVAAALAAVRQCQFFAAALCTFPEGAARNDDCSGPDVAVTPVAIKLSYVFTFQHGGRVSAKAARP